MNRYFYLIAGFCALSLGTAFVAEYVFGLEPCILCLYQRVPFVIGIILPLIALARPQWSKTLLALLGVNFLANAVIAFYHTGVERKWWPSHLEGCSVPDLGDDPAKIMETIMNAPAVRCDEIPWSDPIIGLSMANYNVAWGLVLCALCVWVIGFQKRS